MTRHFDQDEIHNINMNRLIKVIGSASVVATFATTALTNTPLKEVALISLTLALMSFVTIGSCMNQRNR